MLPCSCSVSFPYTVCSPPVYMNNFLRARKMWLTKTPYPHTLPDLCALPQGFLLLSLSVYCQWKSNGLLLLSAGWPASPQGRKHRLIWKISRLWTRQSQAPTLSVVHLNQQLAWQEILIPHIFCQTLKSQIPQRERSALLSWWQAAYIYLILSNPTLLAKSKKTDAMFLEGNPPQNNL